MTRRTNPPTSSLDAPIIEEETPDGAKPWVVPVVPQSIAASKTRIIPFLYEFAAISTIKKGDYVPFH